jgi:hypothetical protein
MSDVADRSELPNDWLEQLQQTYPKRYGPQGWIKVRTLLPQCISAGALWSDVLAGTNGYKRYCDDTQITGTVHVKCASTFYDFRTQGWTEDYAPPPRPRSAADVKLEVRWDQLKARAATIGLRLPTIVESADVYETVLRQAERERSSAAPSATNEPMGNVISMLAKSKAL